LKYLVVSDNHGDRQILVHIAKIFGDDVDFMFHCGDSELAPDDSVWEDFIGVRGNCDYDANFLGNQVFRLGQDTIYLTHGHLENVRMGLTQLLMGAKQAQANIVLFGHTHIPAVEVEQEVLFVNPGSISQPRGTLKVPTFAIIESTPETYQIQYYNRAFHEIEEMSYTFTR
jgi:putative phosphoesterase